MLLKRNGIFYYMIIKFSLSKKGHNGNTKQKIISVPNYWLIVKSTRPCLQGYIFILNIFQDKIMKRNYSERLYRDRLYGYPLSESVVSLAGNTPILPIEVLSQWLGTLMLCKQCT